jgi:coenzyme F420-reducing hydrogenase beta subunit
VLEKGGAVFGAAYNDKFEVNHICVENEADIEKLRGAKYAQSNLCGAFAEVKSRLDRGQRVLFSGTPCQVGGLKAFLRKNYENLLTVDFICHSVPSPMAWREYVKFRAENDNNGRLPESINLRSKTIGWSNYSYSNLFEYGQSTHSSTSGNSLYMKLFVGGYINREACANCQFKGYSRVSDLTIGDFWGIWDIAPEMDDNKGTSVVLVQSEAGAAVLSQIRPRLVVKEVSLEEASCQNQAMLKTAALNERRDEAFGLIRDGKIGECISLLPVPKPVKPSLLRRLRRLVGCLLRKIGIHR